VGRPSLCYIIIVNPNSVSPCHTALGPVADPPVLRSWRRHRPLQCRRSITAKLSSLPGLSLCPPLDLLLCMSVCASVCLSVCLSVCMYAFMLINSILSSYDLTTLSPAVHALCLLYLLLAIGYLLSVVDPDENPAWKTVP